MADFQSIALAALVGFAALLMGLVHRRERARYRRLIRSQEEHIEKLNADMMTVMDDRNRYKGAFEAIAPAPGETHVTRIYRDPPSVEEQIRKMIGPVREGDTRG